jgi:NitT/TauT family transport system substrate-binding protein
MTMSDITVQNMTADDAATAFIAGRVPAAVTWEPHLSMVRDKQQGKVLIDSSSTPGVIVDVVALNCTVIDKQPEDVKALVAGLYKAVQYTKDHPSRPTPSWPRASAATCRSEGAGGGRKGRALLRSGHERKTARPPGKPGDSEPLIKLANETASELQGKPYNVSYDDLVDNRFVSPL